MNVIRLARTFYSPIIRLVFGCLCAVFVLQASTASVKAGIILDDVKANGVVAATAAFANIAGNDAQSGGNPLFGLLNNGGSGTFLDTGNSWTISSGGMFSTTSDLTDGSPLGSLSWIYKEKYAASSTQVSGGSIGTLTFDTPLFANSVGSVVLSLKASNGFSVFAFKDVTNVSHFTFDTNSIVKSNGKNGFGLSHASLFITESDNPVLQSVPEPTSAIWALGILGLATFRRVRNS